MKERAPRGESDWEKEHWVLFLPYSFHTHNTHVCLTHKHTHTHTHTHRQQPLQYSDSYLWRTAPVMLHTQGYSVRRTDGVKGTVSQSGKHTHTHTHTHPTHIHKHTTTHAQWMGGGGPATEDNKTEQHTALLCDWRGDGNYYVLRDWWSTQCYKHWPMTNQIMLWLQYNETKRLQETNGCKQLYMLGIGIVIHFWKMQLYVWAEPG